MHYAVHEDSSLRVLKKTYKIGVGFALYELA